jgi:hypothetical protein
MTWTHRERILAALNHEEADRVPIDFGGAEFTSITLAGYERLKTYLGVTTPTDPMSMCNPVPTKADPTTGSTTTTTSIFSKCTGDGPKRPWTSTSCTKMGLFMAAS